jgi:hypothetical protein
VLLNLVLSLPGSSQAHSNAQVPPDERTREYPFIAERALRDNPHDALINFVGLRTSLHAYASERKHRMGIFFQYLPTGISVAVNGDEPFISASLLKLPTVMKVYRMVEEGSLRKNNVMEITPQVYDTTFGAMWRKGIGARVTVQEAAAYSLQQSDNTAHRMLYFVSQGRPDDMYNYLDMTLATVAGETAVTARNYTSILRSLYFASYLSVESSNEILSHLTQAADGDILRGDVPAQVAIAQKIGAHGVPSSRERVFSFCGIFYAPRRPYTLCVMMNADAETAVRETGEISTMVYRYLAER